MVGGLMPIPEDAAKMGARPAWMGYIAVDDVDASAGKVKAAGGAIYRPPTDIPNIGRSPSWAIRAVRRSSCSREQRPEAPAHDPTKPDHIGWHELHGGDPETRLRVLLGPVRLDEGRSDGHGRMGLYQMFNTDGSRRVA